MDRVMDREVAVSQEDPYVNLANAIVLKAARDYRKALKKLSRNQYNQNALDEKERLERFFRSGWFGVLTSLDPELLIRKLQQEMAE